MIKEQLRMQFLSGVITESEYKAKLEEAEPGNLMLSNAAKQIYQYIKSNKYDAILIVNGKKIGNPEAPFSIQTLGDKISVQGVGSDENTVKDTMTKLQNLILGHFNFLEKNGEPQVKYNGIRKNFNGSIALRIKPDMLKKGQVTESPNDSIESSFEDLKTMASSFDNFEDMGDSFSFQHDTNDSKTGEKIATKTVTISPSSEDKVKIKVFTKSTDPDEYEKAGAFTTDTYEQPISGIGGAKMWLNSLKRRTSSPLNENFVGMGMVGNIFDRKKSDYEDAFDHFLEGKYGLDSLLKEEDPSLNEELSNIDSIYDTLMNMSHEELVSALLEAGENEPGLSLEDWLNGYDHSKLQS